MKEYVSRYRYAKSSPRKVRLVIDLIRGQKVNRAFDILNFSDKRSAVMIKKCLKAAVSDAENVGKADRRNLVVTKCYADCAPTRKGWIPRSRGMANPLLYRSSHITVCVAEADGVKADVSKKEKKN